MKQETSEEKHEKKKKFADLDKSSKRVLLNASSVSKETRSSSSLEFANYFYKKISIGKAKDFFDSLKI